MFQWVDAVFPFVFVLLPLSVFIAVIFFLFVVANGGTVDWYARHLRNGARRYDDDVADGDVRVLAASVEKALETFDARLDPDVQQVSPRLVLPIPLKTMAKLFSNYLP